MIIAAQHAKGERVGTRQDMEKGLLFDGIALERGDVPPGHAEFTADVRAHFANAALAFADKAAMSTRDTANGAAFREAELARRGALIEHVRLRVVGNGAFHGAS